MGLFSCDTCGATWSDDANYTVCPRLRRHDQIRERRERLAAERANECPNCGKQMRWFHNTEISRILGRAHQMCEHCGFPATFPSSDATTTEGRPSSENTHEYVFLSSSRSSDTPHETPDTPDHFARPVNTY